MKKFLITLSELAFLLSYSHSPVQAAGGTTPYGGHPTTDTGIISIESVYIVAIVLFIVGISLIVYSAFLRARFQK